MTSQHRQDQYVLAVLGRVRPGFFLDSGASDGVRCSNTELLEKRYGWTGICVEPNPLFFRQLTQSRDCRCVNCCLYDVDGVVPFVRAGTISGVPDDYASELLPHVRTALGLSDGAALPIEQVACRTPASVLKECGAPRVIDYWSLDTEGSELTILRVFPFQEYLVRMLTVEHNWGPDRAAIRDLLARNGFVWVAELVCDDVYVHGSVYNRNPPRRSRALRRGNSQRLPG
jgi:hypothetical protein